mgnify:CR=1 FL=1
MQTLIRMLALSTLACVLATAMLGCKKQDDTPAPQQTRSTAHTDHDHDDDCDHDHGEEVSLGTTTIGDYEVECWQAHGEVEPGKEMHLIVKLPFNDNGATVVRAWIGTENRLASFVGRGDYAASHDDYDIHAEAPDPLPENAMWWIELERPDGTRAVGSIAVR